MFTVPVDPGYGGLVRWSTRGSEFDYIERGVNNLHMFHPELQESDGLLLDFACTDFSLTLPFADD